MVLERKEMIVVDWFSACAMGVVGLESKELQNGGW